jgi:dephospho-CoA kinase
MPGAGKGVFRRVVQKHGYSIITMGDIIRMEVERRKLEPNPKNMGQVMIDLRKIDGPATIAKRCISRIKNATGKLVFIDGIRSLDEVNEFKKHFTIFFLIAIHTSPKTRYKRLLRRKRPDDPLNWETCMERDLREIGIGMGSVISLADYMVINEGTIVQLKHKTLKFLKKMLEYE